MDDKPHIDMASPEFLELAKSQPFYEKLKNDIGRRVLFEVQLHDPIVVQHEAPPEAFDKILSHIQDVWTALGSEEPHWSVVSTSDFKASNIQNSMSRFHDTGRAEARNALRLLARVGTSIPEGAVGLEYGCGVGRVTRWLADSCRTVVGVDVSGTHLKLARAYIDSQSVTNVALIQVARFTEIEGLPAFDFLYSKIVLQHNPPPVIARLLDVLVRRLNKGGIGIVQIPTYAKGYSFNVDEYIRTMSSIRKMEMHVLPQPVVFDILARHNCRILEVVRDHLVTTVDFVSTTFAFEKH